MHDSVLLLIYHISLYYCLIITVFFSMLSILEFEYDKLRESQW